MSEENNSESANQQHIPEADIPDLKKRDKERKKAGAVWGSAKPVGAPFNGATAAQGAARAAASASSAARFVASAPPAASWFARLGAKGLGQIILAAGAGLFIAGAGLLAYLHRHPASSGAGSPDLGAVSSSIKVRVEAPGSQERLDYAGGKGEIQFDKQAPKTPPKPQPEAAAEAQRADDVELVQQPLPQAQDLMRQAGGAKGMPFGANFDGGNAVLARKEAMAHYGPKMEAPRMLAFSPKGKGGKLSGKSRASIPRQKASQMSSARARSHLAVAQLRFARGMSVMGQSASGDELMRAQETAAFDQNVNKGGEMEVAMPGQGRTPSVTPAGGLDKAAEMPAAAVEPASVNETPYQTPLDQAMNMGAMAGQLKMMGMMLVAVGIMLMIAGIALIAAGMDILPIPIIGEIVGPPLIIAGMALLAAGIAMMAMGFMLMQMASNMGNNAKNLADQQVEQPYGQHYQKEIVDECMDQAVNSGTKPANCNPTTKPNTGGPTGVKEAVQTQQSATYELDAGRPVNGR